ERVVQSRQPLIVSDALRDSTFATARSVVDLRLSSVMCVPLAYRNELLGVLYLGNDNVRNLFAEDERPQQRAEDGSRTAARQSGAEAGVDVGPIWAAADGHTLILGHVGTLAVNPYAMTKQSYDVNRDFQPVSLLARVPNLFVVHPSVPVKNLKELVELAKKKPGALNYGSAGNGSAGHLAFEYLQLVTGTELTHIPYRGTGPQLVDLLAGRTEASSAGAPALLPHIREGKLRAIAVGMPQRIAALADVPTVAEQGYPGFETSQWYGIIAPAGVPKEIVQKLSLAVAEAMKSSAITERFAKDNAVAGGGTPEEFARFIKAEQERWSAVVKKSGLKLD
ncbi:MAG: GAF domain-containing protein, partial [Betaproteobacteria bacterium]|nr:GAF domain-containing protein [Betaproteobacteria bacterium]